MLEKCILYIYIYIYIYYRQTINITCFMKRNEHEIRFTQIFHCLKCVVYLLALSNLQPWKIIKSLNLDKLKKKTHKLAKHVYKAL